MNDEKQTELEALREKAALAKAEVKTAEALEKQRTVLLPQLNRRLVVLDRQIDPLKNQRADVFAAMSSIEHGELTDYRLRRPRKPKATAEGDKT